MPAALHRWPLALSVMRLGWMAGLVFAAAGGAVALWVSLPPLTTQSVPVPETFVAWLQSEHPEELAARLRDPLEVSLRLLYLGASEPIDTQGMKIRVASNTHGELTVTIDDHFNEDDSVDRIYSRITLRREGLIWIPTSHHTARQGRGAFGWTTGPTN